jgi:hypothetical protein
MSPTRRHGRVCQEGAARTEIHVTCSRPGCDPRTRVQVFDLGAEGATPGAVLTKGDVSFTDPRGLALGRGYLFVADTGNNRVQVFRVP